MARFSIARKFGDPCKDCKTPLTPENCSLNRGRIRYLCKECKSKYEKNWRKENPEAHKEYDLKQYGITKLQYDYKLMMQLHGCAICKQPCKTGQDLSVDHNHNTGIVRDLLCRRCNTVLGLVNDDELLLFDILDYLKRHDVQKVG